MPNSRNEEGITPRPGAYITEARRALGEMWGVSRPLSAKEMARALGLSPKNGDDHVRNMENEKTKITGQTTILVGLYLSGVKPPGEVEVFTFDPECPDAAKEVRTFGQAASLAHVQPIAADRVLTTTELAALTGLSEAAIGKMRERGDGPAFTRSGRRVLYEGRAVNEWVASRQRQEADA